MRVKVVYKSKAKAQQAVIEVNESSSMEEIQQIIHKQFHIPLDQISMTVVNPNGERTALKSETKLSDLNLDEHSSLQVKNLGKQIKWEYVFYIQYLGPILILPIAYYFGKRDKYTLVQPLAAFMGVAHYIKRELETAFVHVFSRRTMPFKRVFINSAHYWILFGLLNSIELFFFPRETAWNSNDIMMLFIVWAFMEFCNYKCHEELSSFRSKRAPNSKARGIPKTWGFKYVSCANYLWETLGWLTFSILTKTYTSALFTIVSAAQMADWALKKHKAYQKQFGAEYPKNRKALIPFVL